MSKCAIQHPRLLTSQLESLKEIVSDLYPVRLLEELGADNIIDFAKKAGINSVLKPNKSLALGTSEVSLMELTSAYTVFANMGTWIEPFAIAKVTDSDNKILYMAKYHWIVIIALQITYDSPFRKDI